MISTESSKAIKLIGYRAWSLNRIHIGARIAVLGLGLLGAVGEISAAEFVVERSHGRDDGAAEHQYRSDGDITPPRRADGAIGDGVRESDAGGGGDVAPESPVESTQQVQIPRSQPDRETGPDRTEKDREPHGEKINRALDRY